MTIAKCANFCESQSVPYRLMGITDGFQCCMSTSRELGSTLLTCSACDNYFEYIFESVPGCLTPCPGAPWEAGGCGGSYDSQQFATIYQLINSTFVTPSLVPSVGLWNGLGCYKLVNAHVLQCHTDDVSVIQSAPVLSRSRSMLGAPPWNHVLPRAKARDSRLQV